MKFVIVGISDCKVSTDLDSVLLTYALGSCVAVAAHDPVAGVGGLLHFMLPEAAPDHIQSTHNPYRFADTGIPMLLEDVCARGARYDRLVVRLVGGAQILDDNDLFQIGRRNYLAAREVLGKAGIPVASEAVGGEVSRTVRLEIRSGRTWVREDGIERSMAETSPLAKGD